MAETSPEGFDRKAFIEQIRVESEASLQTMNDANKILKLAIVVCSAWQRDWIQRGRPLPDTELDKAIDALARQFEIARLNAILRADPEELT